MLRLYTIIRCMETEESDEKGDMWICSRGKNAATGCEEDIF